MDISRRVLITKVLLLVLLVLLANRAIFSFWLVRQMIDADPIIVFVGLRELFIPLISIILFSMLWGMLKLEYILLVASLGLIFGGSFEPLSVSAPVIKILQSTGLLLFLIAVVRIVVFLLSRRSAKALEVSIEKWMEKRS